MESIKRYVVEEWKNGDVFETAFETEKKAIEYAKGIARNYKDRTSIFVEERVLTKEVLEDWQEDEWYDEKETTIEKFKEYGTLLTEHPEKYTTRWIRNLKEIKEEIKREEEERDRELGIIE